MRFLVRLLQEPTEPRHGVLLMRLAAMIIGHLPNRVPRALRLHVASWLPKADFAEPIRATTSIALSLICIEEQSSTVR